MDEVPGGESEDVLSGGSATEMSGDDADGGRDGLGRLHRSPGEE